MMTVEPSAPAEADPFDRLTSELDHQRGGVFDTLRMRPETLVGILGIFCACLGVGLILLAWSGVSHSVYLQQELAYLVSGGLLGLALVVIGGFLFLGHLVMRYGRSLERMARHADQVRVDVP